MFLWKYILHDTSKCLLGGCKQIIKKSEFICIRSWFENRILIRRAASLIDILQEGKFLHFWLSRLFFYLKFLEYFLLEKWKFNFYFYRNWIPCSFIYDWFYSQISRINYSFIALQTRLNIDPISSFFRHNDTSI